MKQRECALRLYQATCPSDGCSEGVFRYKQDDSRLERRYQYARDIITRHIQNTNGIHVWSGGIVKSEQEAKQVIKAMQEVLDPVDSLVTLVNCYHGRILFDRVARFQGVQPEQILEALRHPDLEELCSQIAQRMPYSHVAIEEKWFFHV